MNNRLEYGENYHHATVAQAFDRYKALGFRVGATPSGLLLVSLSTTQQRAERHAALRRTIDAVIATR